MYLIIVDVPLTNTVRESAPIHVQNAQKYAADRDVTIEAQPELYIERDSCRNHENYWARIRGQDIETGNRGTYIFDMNCETGYVNDFYIKNGTYDMKAIR